jgi:uncharacterized protein (DUF427 family)
MLMQAVFNGRVIAESDDTLVVEGNHYFPADSLRQRYFAPSSTVSLCPWKGMASYFDVRVEGVVGADAAWTYEHPLPLARRIKGRVAFWRGVEVRRAPDASAAGAAGPTGEGVYR